MELRACARSVFELIKWYADAVSAEGAFLIAYSARLRYGRASVNYSSVLDPAGQRHSLRPSTISAGPDGFRWRTPSLAIDARWLPRAPEIRETIFETAEGAVDWHCLAPAADAILSGEARLGYLERLHLTIPPWRLPLRTLRWGRYLSLRHSLVWIDWQGDYTRRSVFLDSAPISAAEISDHALHLADGTSLILDRSLVIRNGGLGSTVLHAIPALRRMAPASVFLLEECKWRSRAQLSRTGEPPDSGWCIHEVVRWP